MLPLLGTDAPGIGPELRRQLPHCLYNAHVQVSTLTRSHCSNSDTPGTSVSHAPGTTWWFSHHCTSFRAIILAHDPRSLSLSAVCTDTQLRQQANVHAGTTIDAEQEAFSCCATEELPSSTATKLQMDVSTPTCSTPVTGGTSKFRP